MLPDGYRVAADGWSTVGSTIMARIFLVMALSLVITLGVYVVAEWIWWQVWGRR